MKIRVVKIDPVFYKKTGWVEELSCEEVEVDSDHLYDDLKKLTRFGAYVLGYEAGRMWSLCEEGSPFIFINGVISHRLYKEAGQDWLWIKVVRKILNSAIFFTGIGAMARDITKNNTKLMLVSWRKA